MNEREKCSINLLLYICHIYIITVFFTLPYYLSISTSVYLQVLFAFMVGLHNLYWYYGSQKVKVQYNNVQGESVAAVNAAEAFQG